MYNSGSGVATCVLRDGFDNPTPASNSFALRPHLPFISLSLWASSIVNPRRRSPSTMAAVARTKRRRVDGNGQQVRSIYFAPASSLIPRRHCVQAAATKGMAAYPHPKDRPSHLLHPRRPLWPNRRLIRTVVIVSTQHRVQAGVIVGILMNRLCQAVNVTAMSLVGLTHHALGMMLRLW